MDKRTPHYRLQTIQSLIEAGKVRTTHSARAGANALGFDYAGMLAVVAVLNRRIFTRA